MGSQLAVEGSLRSRPQPSARAHILQFGRSAPLRLLVSSERLRRSVAEGAVQFIIHHWIWVEISGRRRGFLVMRK